jgi:hypothetical protein
MLSAVAGEDLPTVSRIRSRPWSPGLDIGTGGNSPRGPVSGPSGGDRWLRVGARLIDIGYLTEGIEGVSQPGIP